MQLRAYLTPALVTVLVALAVPTSAMLVETPLRLAADDKEPDNRQNIKFQVGATNDTTRDQLAGKDVIVRWAVYDENGSAQEQTILRDDLVLDGEARLDFTWTLPAEADDRNLFVTIERGEELLAQVHLAVGDAEPMLMLMSEMGPEDAEPSDGIEEEEHSEPANVPGLGIIAAVLGLALVGIGARRL